MNLRGKRALRVLITVAVITVMTMSLCINAFAWEAQRSDLSGGVLTVPDGTTVVDINSVSAYYENNADKIVIPNSVTLIKNGSFSDCEDAEVAVVDNYEGGLTIESQAFAKGTKITYLRENPKPQKDSEDNTPAVTNPPAPTTTKAAPHTTAAPVTKRYVTTTRVHKEVTTTEAPEETTTEETTTDVEITDATPFADAKEQLADVDVWDELINQTTEAAEAPMHMGGKTAQVASYSAVVCVALSAIGLGYLKFRR